MSDDDDLAAFFSAIPAARRREYEVLAERDRRFGEDVGAELRDPPAREREGGGAS